MGTSPELSRGPDPPWGWAGPPGRARDRFWEQLTATNVPDLPCGFGRSDRRSQTSDHRKTCWSVSAIEASSLPSHNDRRGPRSNRFKERGSDKTSTRAHGQASRRGITDGRGDVWWAWTFRLLRSACRRVSRSSTKNAALEVPPGPRSRPRRVDGCGAGIDPTPRRRGGMGASCHALRKQGRQNLRRGCGGKSDAHKGSRPPRISGRHGAGSRGITRGPGAPRCGRSVR